jgi:hypothetical protein
MRISCLLLGLIAVALACKPNEDASKKLQKAAIDYYFKNISKLKRIDTIYIKIDTVTPVGLAIMQTIEYSKAIDEAKNSGSKDSLKYQEKYDEAIHNSDKINNKQFLLYKVQSMAQFVYEDGKQGSASTIMFYDKEIKEQPYETVVERISKQKGIYDLNIEADYTPFMPGAFENFKMMGFEVLFDIIKPK